MVTLLEFIRNPIVLKSNINIFCITGRGRVGLLLVDEVV